MTGPKCLYSALQDTPQRDAQKIALIDQNGIEVTYSELFDQAKCVADFLQLCDIRPGDRVGIFMKKSWLSVAIMLGSLRAGASYVPLDSSYPVLGASRALLDAGVKLTFVESSLEESLSANAHETHLGLGLFSIRTDKCLKEQLVAGKKKEFWEEPSDINTEDTAFILYTSGTTGAPKGVAISHGAALSFVNWCTSQLPIGADDVFAMYAPHHFDLSVFDIFACLSVGATGIIINDEVKKSPLKVMDILLKHNVTVWYSTPTAMRLTFLQDSAIEFLERSSLRILIYAGEEFPVKELRRLVEALPHAKYFNFFGPTETNVCTYFEIMTPLDPRAEAVPIGRPCEHLKVSTLETPDGHEMIVSGPSVMLGYWNQPELTQQTFWSDASGVKWYRTGDLVQFDQGLYWHLGRLDRQIKKNGHRVDLAQVERALQKMDGIKDSAVLAFKDENGNVLVAAFVVPHQGHTPTVISIRSFCTKNVSSHAAPDRVFFVAAIPTTSTSKINYQVLKERVLQ